MSTKHENNTLTRPREVTLIVVLSAIMVYRISTLNAIQFLGSEAPLGWVVPFTGDAFMGITALIVAYLLLKKRGLAVWTIGVTWQIVGIKDYISGIMLSFVDPITGPIFPGPEFPTFVMILFLTIGMLIQISVIYLLSRPNVRQFYLNER